VITLSCDLNGTRPHPADPTEPQTSPDGRDAAPEPRDTTVDIGRHDGDGSADHNDGDTPATSTTVSPGTNRDDEDHNFEDNSQRSLARHNPVRSSPVPRYKRLV
jgi:hypothetical protein